MRSRTLPTEARCDSVGASFFPSRVPGKATTLQPAETPTSDAIPQRHSGAGFFLGVLLASAAMLWLETLLPRVFAVYMAANFVFFSVSIALVGVSSGGIALYVWEDWFVRGGKRRLVDLALGFALATLVAAWAFALLGGELNAVVDDIYAGVLGRRHEGEVLTTRILIPSMLFVVVAGFLMALPFFFAGATVALAFRLAPRRAGTVYAYDLIGAGIGCALTVASLTWTSAPQALVLVGALGAVAATVFLTARPSASPAEHRRWRTATAAGALLALGLLAIRPPFDFDIHRYAYLRSYFATGLTELAHRWTPLGRVVLAQREWVPPLNPEPTMRSLSFVGMDLGGFAVVESYSPENLARIKETSVFTDEIMEPIAVPGMYSEVDEILVLMAGTGQDLLRAYAWYGDESRLTGVELNPAVTALGLEHPTADLEAFFAKPNVEMVMGDGRAYVEQTSRKFDLIFLSYSGATFASGTGVISSTPQFLMTREAFVAYLEALAPGGTLVGAEAMAEPPWPSGMLRTFAAALDEFRPGADLGRHVLAYTRPGILEATNYTLFFRDPLTRADVERIRHALAEHDLIITWSAFTESAYPGLERFMSQWEATGGRGPGDASAWLGLPRWARDRVHTDDHPFFYFDLGPNQPGQFLVLGYVGMTLTALLIAAVFLMVPLLVSRRRRRRGAAAGQRPGAFFHVAFALLGLGFMLIEVGAIQRFELLLGYPTLSLVVILAALLIFAGAGSHFSQRFFATGRLSIPRVAAGVVLYGGFLLGMLELGIYPLLSLPLTARIGVIAALLFPLGLLLGSLFPRLLTLLEGDGNRFIPWGIAINGIFSVVAANLGVLIYLFFGANVVLMLGIACYAALGVAALLWGTLPPYSSDGSAAPVR